MLIYEKDNKLNISFENNMEETDIVVGKDEVKIGEATISDSNVLPVPEEGDTGKVPTVQEDGSYALANVGGGSSPLVVTFSGTTTGGDATCDKTWDEISENRNNVSLFYKNGIVLTNLSPVFIGDSTILGNYYSVGDPSSPTDEFVKISASIQSNNQVNIYYMEQTY